MKAYRRAGHVAWREVAGEFVVVNLVSRTITGLNRAGGAILELLGAAAPPDLLAARFEPAGDGLGERAAAVETFCEELRALGVVEAADDAGPAAGPRAEPVSVSWTTPRIMWHEPLTAVVRQSPLPAIGDPSCGY